MTSQLTRPLSALSLCLLLSFPALDILTQWHRADQKGINPPPVSYVPEIVGMCLCALIFLISLALFSERSDLKRCALRIRTVLIVLGAVSLLGIDLWSRFHHAWKTSRIGTFVLLLGAVIVGSKFHESLGEKTLSELQRFALIVLLPLIVTHSWRLVYKRQLFLPKVESWISISSTVGTHEQRIAKKIVVLIFDEFDDYIARKELRVGLPEFENLARHAVSFEHVFPAADWTAVSIPLFLSGRMFDRAFVADRDSYWIREFDTHTWVRLQDVDRVFKTARQHSYSVRILGWYLPYCKTFRGVADVCHEAPARGNHFEHGLRFLMEEGKWSASISGWLEYYWFSLFERALSQRKLPFSLDRRVYDEKSIAYSEWMMEMWPVVKSWLSDSNDAFMWIHVPFPHPPSLDAKLDYGGSLRLADGFLGAVMDVLESAGHWESTAIVVTSDHGLREFWHQNSLSDVLGVKKSMKHGLAVPLLVRFPGQGEGIRVAVRISNAFVHNVVMGMLRGQVSVSNISSLAEREGERRITRIRQYPFI